MDQIEGLKTNLKPSESLELVSFGQENVQNIPLNPMEHKAYKAPIWLSFRSQQHCPRLRGARDLRNSMADLHVRWSMFLFFVEGGGRDQYVLSYYSTVYYILLHCCNITLILINCSTIVMYTVCCCTLVHCTIPIF